MQTGSRLTKAYKYFDSKLEDIILGEGRFRVGTLYDYRRNEEYGSEIGDKNEGSLNAHSSVLSWTSGNPSLANEHAGMFVRQPGTVSFGAGDSISFGPGGSISFSSDGRVRMQNVGLQSRLHIADLYVLSLSAEPKRELMVKMGYDACFEISDVEAFLALLPAPPNSQLMGCSFVSYQSRNMHYQAARTVNPAFIKEPQFAYQKEIRAVWAPSQARIEAAIMQSKAAAQLCRRIEL